MRSVTKGDILTLENSSGNTATIRIDHVFSSRIFFTQLSMTGVFDLHNQPYISPDELNRYTILTHAPTVTNDRNPQQANAD